MATEAIRLGDKRGFDRNVKKFRLLVISSDPYPPTRVDVSVLFGEELAGRGHRIDWLLQSEQHCTHSFVAAWGGGRAWVASANHRSSLRSRLHKHFAGIWNDTRVFGLLKSGEYDGVEVKDKFLSGVFALLAARLHRKKFIYWLSYPFPEEYKRRASDGTGRYPFLYWIRGSAFGLLLYRILLPRADHVFVQSEEMRRVVARKGIPLEKMTAVPMGIRAPQSSDSSGSHHTAIPPGVRSFLYLGSLSRSRYIDFLLRVLVKARAGMPEVKLYLVGQAVDAEDDVFLKQEARRLGIADSVIFVGQLPQAQALQYVQDTDVCVSPLYPTPVFNVATPTKLVEYMAMGKPVVANTHPDQQFLIEQSGGGYCVPYEEEAFADAILKLLRAPDMARMMGERGKRYALAHRTYRTIADVVEQQMINTLASST
jgi:glycosyltransferase involved in cell wall biosynthesis